MKNIARFSLSLLILISSFGVVSAQSASPTATLSLSPTTTRPPRPSGKLNACLSLQNSLKTRADNAVRHSETLITKFTAITTRVDEFYKTKNVPAGKTLPNYAQLMSQIETNKTKVTTAVNKAKTTLAGFSCDNNPRATMQAFRKDMLAVIASLKAYKTSVRNLIVAVHRVTPNNVTATPSSTVTP